MNLILSPALQVSSASSVEQCWSTFLHEPAREFMSRPKKEFRAELVSLGCRLYSKGAPLTEKQKSVIAELSRVLEWIHAGSLIVDDIQDDSQERRGGPTAHRLYGVGPALNLGNWMYFEALKGLHALAVDDSVKLKIISCAHEAMHQAHLGQALDLGANMKTLSAEQIQEVVHKSHSLKSGALVALALQVGALIGDAQADLQLLRDLGMQLGSSLQRFDDLGNLKFNCTDGKALEDLKLGRPSWIWMFLASCGDSAEIRAFKDCLEFLPETHALESFVQSADLKKRAHAEALRLHREMEERLKASFAGLENAQTLNLLKNLTERIVHAYE
ncbi:polyprenyl synthetase family protein [Bdellovibrio bacteriovorus]|uniref:polyprenyl synthetase family protein n=1 Tax=Bdellovibrio bacteriovorus TaxID=959 RepID=UPI003AA95D77